MIKKKRSQASLEYIAVIGFALVALIPVISFATSEINQMIRHELTKKSLSSIKDAAEKVSLLGPGSKTYTWVEWPGGISFSNINNTKISVVSSDSGKETEYYEISFADVEGNLNPGKGKHMIYFEVLDNGIVRITDRKAESTCGNDIVESGEECDGITIPGSCNNYGFHTGNLVCNSCEISTSNCGYFGYPYILINEPENNFSSGTGNITFSFSVEGNGTYVSDCTLHVNNESSETLYDINSQSTHEFTVDNLTSGNYLWNINCYVTTTNQNISSPNKTFDVSFLTTVPQIIGPKSCIASELSNNKEVFNVSCLGNYSSTCPENKLGCDDSITETFMYNKNKFASLKLTYFDANVNDCLSISDVFVCYEWWATSDGENCDITIDDNNDPGLTIISTQCPGQIPQPGISCINATSYKNWSCDSFFDENVGSIIISEMDKIQSVPQSVENSSWDTIYYNISYIKTT